MKGEIKRDTAVFGPQQWYIDGYDPMFTTASDAENAKKFSNIMVTEAQSELADKVRAAVDIY